MFNNLTKEIVYYSLIPVVILAIIALVLLFIKKKNNDKYKFNYLIKVILMLIDGMVLSLLVGYSIWATERYIRNGTVSSNIIYVIIFVVLIAILVFLLFITCNKLYKSFNYRDDYINDFENEKETS